jgi:tetratricopeptide (TPR) repeat protein
MQTPVRLVLLALLGSCASGASTTSSETPRDTHGDAPTAAATTAEQAPTDALAEPVEEAFDAAAQRAVTPPPLTEADAATFYQSGDTLAALKAYAQLMQETIAALREAEAPTTPDTEPDTVAAARLHAELEWLLVSFRRAGKLSGDKNLCRQYLDTLAIEQTDGTAWALTRWCYPNPAEDLSMLTDWQFIGPFDNERGIALDSQLQPETDPTNLAAFAGKVRPVLWRTTPPVAPADGILDFSLLLEPAEQTAVLLRTWVNSSTDQAAFLMLGIAGEARVWHDGTTVLHAGGEHAMHIDSLAAPLKLHAGWNEITVKLGSRDHAPRLQARLVQGSDGRALHLAHSSTLPEGLLPQKLSAAEPEEVFLAPPGAIAYYLATTYVSPENAMAYYRLGALQRWYQTAPKSMFPGRDDLRKAVELAPDMLRYRIDYAGALFPADDIDAEEADLNPWLQQAQLILEQEPGQAFINMQRVIATLRYQKIENLGLQAVARLEAAGHDEPWLLGLKAALYEEFDHDALAYQTRMQNLQHAKIANYPRILLPTLRKVMRKDDPRRAERLREVYATTGNTSALTSILRWQRQQRDTFDATLELQELEQLMQVRPWSSATLRNYAERFQSQGDLETAFALVERALELKPEAAATLALKARLHLAAGQLEDAVVALEKELDIDFTDEDERRLLDHLQSLEGATFDAPYHEDLADILARHGELSAEQGSKDYSHEYLLYRSVVRVNPDSTANRYFRKVIRVLNANGVRELDEMYFPFSWGDEELRVLTVSVMHPDGSIETARTDSGWRASQVDLPPLQVGDIIDLEWKVSDRGTTFFGKYFAIDHAMTADRSVPTRESQLVLLVPEELPLEFHTIRLEGAEAEVGIAKNFGTSHTWTVRDLAPQRIENMMPHAEETVARVQATSYASWDAFGTWWWNLIDAGITVSPEMKAKVAALIAGKPSLRDQVAAIYGFVANDIRYNAWEFGVHGYQPYTAPVIFSRQFGDCKDKSILLRAMLSEIGVEAYPVLIMRTGSAQHGGRRHEEDLSLAMVNHFNHCIAYIPAQQDLPAMYLDGTARLHPLDVLPYDDRGAQVLIVKPDGIERVRIPFSEATDNTRAESYRISFATDGSAQVEMFLAPQGRWDPTYRSAFAGGDQERKEKVERMLSAQLGPLDGDVNYDIQDVEKLDQALHLQFGAKVKSLARVVEGRLEIPAMLNTMNLLQGLASEAERETDLLMDAPWVRDITIDIVLPEGWNMSTLPPAIDVSNLDATYHWSIERSATGLRIRERYEMLTHRIPVERYPAFRALCRVIDNSQDRYLEITPPPPPGLEETAEATPEEAPAVVPEDQK